MTTRVIHIKSDDIGYGDLGCYGGSALTPNIDSLATNGRKFTRFCVASPICSPSRAAFLTGRHPQFYKVFFADLLTTGVFSDKCWLPPGSTTVAHWCQMVGAATGLFGKWHLGHPGNLRGAGMPTVHGFQEWFIHPYIWENLSTYTDRPWIGDSFPSPPVEVVTGHLSDITAERAIAFIEAHAADAGGFYLHVEFFAAHHPLEDVDEMSLYPSATTDEQRYWGQISRMDARIGDILDALDDAGILEDTHVIFTSDNGPAYTQTPGSAAPFRGGKTQLWHGGICVPLLWQGPGVSTGSTDSVPRIATDWLPTMGELFGFDVSGYEGSDMLAATGTRDLFWSFTYDQPGADDSGAWAMMRGNIKLHHFTSDGATREFYDLTADDGEGSANELTIVASGAGAGEINQADADDMTDALVAWTATVPVEAIVGDPSTAATMQDAVDTFNAWYAEEVTNFSVHFVGVDSAALDTLESALLTLGDLPRTHTLPWGGTLEETDLATRRGTHDTLGGPSLIMSKAEWLACFDPTRRARLSAPELVVLDYALAFAIGQRDNR